MLLLQVDPDQSFPLLLHNNATHCVKGQWWGEKIPRVYAFLPV